MFSLLVKLFHFLWGQHRLRDLKERSKQEDEKEKGWKSNSLGTGTGQCCGSVPRIRIKIQGGAGSDRYSNYTDPDSTKYNATTNSLKNSKKKAKINKNYSADQYHLDNIADRFKAKTTNEKQAGLVVQNQKQFVNNIGGFGTRKLPVHGTYYRYRYLVRHTTDIKNTVQGFEQGKKKNW